MAMTIRIMLVMVFILVMYLLIYLGYTMTFDEQDWFFLALHYEWVNVASGGSVLFEDGREMPEWFGQSGSFSLPAFRGVLWPVILLDPRLTVDL